MLEGAGRPRGEQGAGAQPAVWGGAPYTVGVSPSLDRHGDVSAGREAAVGTGGVSGAQGRGADPPRLARQRSVQAPDALALPEPSAGMGAEQADDHRRSLSGGESRAPGAGGRLDCREAHL